MKSVSEIFSNFNMSLYLDIISKAGDIAVTIGVFIAMLELWSRLRRERKIDSSSVSVAPETKDGSFTITNNGSVSIDLELHSGIYIDGKIERDSEKLFQLNRNKKRDEVRKLSFKHLLSATLNAKENLVFYPFDINSNEIFVFAGALRVIIGGKYERYYLTTFTGKRIKHSETLREKSHPQFSWIIRDIF